MKGGNEPVEGGNGQVSGAEKPRVLLVHGRYQLRGGEEQVVENELALLEANGHWARLYERDNSELRRGGLRGLLAKLRLPFTTLFSLRTYRDVRRLIAEEAVDVVHVHNTLPLISPSVYYAARSRGVPVVQTVHNFRLQCPNGLFFREGHICADCVTEGLRCAVRHRCYRGSRAQSALVAFMLWLHRRLGTYDRVVTAYICLTDFNQEKLARTIPAEKIVVKPNFVPDRAPVPLEATIAPGGYVFLGRLSPEKGVDTLLEAFAGMPDRRLTIIGDGPLGEGLAEAIHARGLTNIVMQGRMDNDAARAAMRHARALVMPTRFYEGFSLVIVEAYAEGVPVLGSNMGNVAAVIDVGESGDTFDPALPESLCACVARFEREWPPGRRLPERYARMYDPDENYRQLAAIYAKVVKA